MLITSTGREKTNGGCWFNRVSNEYGSCFGVTRFGTPLEMVEVVVLALKVVLAVVTVLVVLVVVEQEKAAFNSFGAPGTDFLADFFESLGLTEGVRLIEPLSLVDFLDFTVCDLTGFDLRSSPLVIPLPTTEASETGVFASVIVSAHVESPEPDTDTSTVSRACSNTYSLASAEVMWWAEATWATEAA